MNEGRRKKDAYNTALISNFALVKKFGVANPVISKKTLSQFYKAKSKCNETKDNRRKTNTIQHFISNFALVKKFGVANPVIS